MIPAGITRDHVLAALSHIDGAPVPPSRQSVDYDLVHAGKTYPPKYVVSVAAKHATGDELPPDRFTAGTVRNFLEKLGFEVVKRSRVLTGPDADVEDVRLVFERLVRDEAVRKLCAAIFAETIELAHAAGEARWQITLQRDLIRLNGGRVLLFDVRAADVFIGVNPTQLASRTLIQLEDRGIRQESFVPLPQMHLFRLPHAALPSLWAAIAPGFRAFVMEAALTARRCVWFASHSPAVVELLSELVGKTLPQPSYGEVNPPEASECRVYWVNQGQSFEAEVAGQYLFARHKSAGGGTPSHWARLRDLVPGDLVVHHAGGEVLAISRVRKGATDWRRSEAPGDDGLRVNLETWKLPTPIDSAALFASEEARVAARLTGEHGPLDKSGIAKQGYLWRFSEEGLAALKNASLNGDAWPAWAAPIQNRYWMFHANPALYDIRGAVRALSELSFRVKQHRTEIQVGDLVFLWETGPAGGIVAVARVLSDPAPLELDPREAPFCKPDLQFDPNELQVRLKIERVLEPILSADSLRAEPLLAGLPAFASPQRSNSAVSSAQGALLLRWAEGERTPRVVKIAPGDGGELWGECLAGGYICVGWDEVGDLRQFEKWSDFRAHFAKTSELGKPKNHVTRKAQELWTLASLKPGDKVVANRGISRILGVGTVKAPGYVWDESRSSYKHTVRVDWDQSVATDIPPHKHWGVTTIDKVPPHVLALILPTGARPENAEPKDDDSVVADRPFKALQRSLQNANGLWFSTEVLAHYLLCLQAKRFVILTGISGTGKTQLALGVARHFQSSVRRARAAATTAVTQAVSPYMSKHRRIVLPKAFAVDLELPGIHGSGSTVVDVECPRGKAQLRCYREVRSAVFSVTQLSLKGPVLEWIRSLEVGDQLAFELIETDPERPGIRITTAHSQEELVQLRNYEVIPVRPDWTDGRGLLGFYNPLTQRYVTTPFLRLLLDADAELKRAEAEKREPTPFFAILDEMNLARVEQYFSDFLSALESDEPICLHDDPNVESGEFDDGDEEASLPVPQRLKVPPNLFFTGTVNVDETTFMFSPKVLDRAFVIEFNDVNLEDYGTRERSEDDASLALVNWAGLLQFRPVKSHDWDSLTELQLGQVKAKLKQLHELLESENRHFGYRVANEMGRFITLAHQQCADQDEGLANALDLAIASKVLPKLHGTQQELEELLLRLFQFATDDAHTRHEDWKLSEGELVRVAAPESGPDPAYPRCAAKLWRMLRRLRSQGFTSFIE